MGKTSYHLTCIALLTLTAGIYYPTAMSFAAHWDRSEQAYAHGYSLLLLCLALALRQTSSLLSTSNRIYSPALLPLLACNLIWFVGSASQVLVLQQLAVPGIFFFTLVGLFGVGFASSLRFPFLLFYAAVPVWDALIPWLQLFTVKICTIALNLVDIPVYIEQTQITTPSGTLQVAGGCSGLNFLLMIGTIAALYAHLYYRVFWHKVLLLVIAAAFGLTCNWIRVLILVFIGHTRGMTHPILLDHELFGWMIFSTCLLPLLLIAQWIEKRPNPATLPPPARLSPATDFHWPLSALVIALTANLGPMWQAITSSQPAKTSIHQALSNQHNMLAPLGAPTQWQPALLDTDEHSVLRFIDELPQVQVHIATYLAQRQGRELIHWGNQLVDERQWQIGSKRTVTGPDQSLLRLISLKSGAQRAELLYWYAVGNYFTHSDLAAKSYQLMAHLQGREDASLIAMFYPCPAASDCEHLRQEVIRATTKVKRAYADSVTQTLLRSRDNPENPAQATPQDSTSRL